MESMEYLDAIADLNKAIKINSSAAAEHFIHSRNTGAHYKNPQGLFGSGSNRNTGRSMRDVEYDMAEMTAASVEKLKAEKHLTDNATAYYLRGRSNFMLLEYKSAIDDYSIALEIDSMNSVVYCSRAEAELELGLRELACRDICKAKELGDSTAYVVESNYMD